MSSATRIGHTHRTSTAEASPLPAPLAAPSATDRWADTLASLVRSHRVRLGAPDPSRPWLTDDAAAPAAGLGPEDVRAGD
jgi:hypothetical protein